jgi:nucleoside-diphosphate-sugar epimerase
MRALVTGGAGFIGSAVVRRVLAGGGSVVVLDDLSTGFAENLEGLKDVTLQVGDIRDRSSVDRAMGGADVVFHLAAEVGNLRSLNDPIEDASTNLLGTICVLESARHARVTRVVVSSSAAVYGELERIPIDEDHPTRPDTPYGVSKLAAEKVSLCYGKLFNMTIVALRYFNVYGVRQRFDAYGNVIPIFCERLLAHDPLITYGDGRQSRDFVNVIDVAEANFQAATTATCTGCYNVGTGVATTILDLIEIVTRVSGRQPQVQEAPKRPGEVLHSLADISAARQALGYLPAVSLEDGLREYWQWRAAGG